MLSFVFIVHCPVIRSILVSPSPSHCMSGLLVQWWCSGCLWCQCFRLHSLGCPVTELRMWRESFLFCFLPHVMNAFFQEEFCYPVECLALTVEEVMHIRQVLVKAELEKFQQYKEIYTALKKGKVEIKTTTSSRLILLSNVIKGIRQRSPHLTVFLSSFAFHVGPRGSPSSLGPTPASSANGKVNHCFLAVFTELKYSGCSVIWLNASFISSAGLCVPSALKR